MEISIKWNICRLCMYEEQEDEQISARKSIHLILSEEMTAKQIFDCSGVMVSLGDGLPDKICRKCLTILKYIKKFRKCCIESEKYLQTVMQRTKSASTLFHVECVGMERSYDVLRESFEGLVEDGETLQKMSVGEVIDNFVEDNEDESDELLINGQQNITKEVESVILDTKSKLNKSNDVKYSLKSRKKIKSTDCLVPSLIIDQQSQDSSEEASCVKIENESENYILAHQLPADVIISEHNQFEETLLDEQEFYVSPDSVEIIEEVPTSLEDDATEAGTLLNGSKVISSDLITGENIINKGVNGESIVIQTSEASNVENGFFFLLNNLKTNENGEEIHTVLEDRELEFLPIEEDGIEMAEEFYNNEHVAVENGDNSQTEEANIVQNNAEDSLQEDHTTFENFEQTENTEYSLEDYVDQEIDDNKNTGEVEQLMIMKSTVHRVGTQIIMSIGPKNENNRYSRKSNHSMRATKLSSSLYVCHICGNHFSSRQLMNGHLKIHRQEKTHECELCSKRFITSCNLQAHMRIHTGEKPYECKYCKRRFTDRSTHLRHERIHTNEKPFPCKECGKSFSLATTLQAHRKVHSGERPYRCTLCAKSFKLPHQLKAHKNSFVHKSVEQLGS